MEKRVKDIMLPIENCPAVTGEASVKDAIGLLAKVLEAGPCTGGTTLLVMEKNTLTGTLGLKELMQAMDPAVFKGGTYRGWTVPAEMAPPLFLKGMFSEKCRDLSGRRVKDLMSPVPRLLDAEDTLIKAVHVLVEGGHENVPVWQGDRVVGLVGSLELVDEAAALQLSTEAGAASRKKQAAG